MDKKKNFLPKEIIWFIILVLLISWIFTLLIKFFNLSQSPLTAVMIFPALLTLIFIFISKKEKFSSIGWKLPQAKYWLISIFLPIFQMAIIVALGFSLGLLSYNSLHLITHKPTPYSWLNLLICIPAMFIPIILLSLPSFFIGWLNHLGEEFAWRGYLFRKVSENSGSLVKGVFISGIVWWFWHLPMFWVSPILNKLNIYQIGLIIFTSLFGLLGAAVIYAWIYVISGSIWAPTIMHIFWNLYRGILTGRLADGTLGLFKGNLWLINGEGIIGNIITALLGSFIMGIFFAKRSGHNYFFDHA